MQAKVIDFGNSKGIIIPQDFLDQCGIKNAIDIAVENNQIIISTSGYNKREGWAKAFKEMAKNGYDKLVISDVLDDEKFED